jgi:hypothetical protein
LIHLFNDVCLGFGCGISIMTIASSSSQLKCTVQELIGALFYHVKMNKNGKCWNEVNWNRTRSREILAVFCDHLWQALSSWGWAPADCLKIE